MGSGNSTPEQNGDPQIPQPVVHYGGAGGGGRPVMPSHPSPHYQSHHHHHQHHHASFPAPYLETEPDPQLRPLPTAETRQTRVVRSPLTLHKTSVVLEVPSADCPQRHVLSFDFDATVPVRVSVHCVVRAVPAVAGQKQLCFQPLHPQGRTIVQDFGPGEKQRFSCIVELPIHDSALMRHEAPDKYPLVVELTSLANDPAGPSAQLTFFDLQPLFSTGRDGEMEGTGGPTASDPLLVQRTNARWKPQALRQQVVVLGRVFEVNEIFGLDQQQKDDTSGRAGASRECVVCLSEPPTTAVLPCRHMCLCSGCASVMRLHSNLCPMCRQVATGFLHIDVDRRNA